MTCLTVGHGTPLHQNPFDIPTTAMPEGVYLDMPSTALPPTNWLKLEQGSGIIVPPYDYEVKSWPWLFSEMITGVKKHDMRDKRDRDYKVGDVMKLREFDPRNGSYTGRWALFRITYITDNVTPCAMSSGALDNNFAILSVEKLEESF